MEVKKKKIKKIEIDLQDLYDFEPQTLASEMLEKILENYKYAEIVLLLNVSPDTGLEIFTDDKRLKHEALRLNDELERYYKELDNDAEVKSEDEYIERLATITDADAIVELHDGYEYSVAFVKKFKS